MSKIRVDPIVSAVRCYEVDIDSTLPLYKMQEKYYKTFNILLMDNGVVRVSCMIEAPDFKEYKELKDYLVNQGYHTVEWRHGDKVEEFKLI